MTTIPQGAVIPGPSGRRSQVLAVSALSSVENKKCGCKIKVLKVMTAKNFLLMYDMAFFKNCPEKEETTI